MGMSTEGSGTRAVEITSQGDDEPRGRDHVTITEEEELEFPMLGASLRQEIVGNPLDLVQLEGQLRNVKLEYSYTAEFNTNGDPERFQVLLKNRFGRHPSGSLTWMVCSS